MNHLQRRLVRWSLLTTTGLVFGGLNGCYLSDQQLASIWQTVLTSGLNTIVTNILSGAVPAA